MFDPGGPLRLNKKSYRAAGVIALALMLTTGCTSDELTAEVTTPNNSATAEVTASATPSPTSTTPPAAEAPPAPWPAPAPEVPAQDDGDPNSFMEFQPQQAITTPEQATEVMMKDNDYNPDFIYDAHPNEYGNFDVKIRSKSIMDQGGTGTVGIWEVKPDGNRFLKGTAIR